MNWAVLILALLIGGLLAVAISRGVERRFERWPPGRRRLTSVAALPLVILLATLLGLAWVAFSGPGEGENMQDLALIVTASFGALFAFLMLIGGLVGLAIAGRGRAG